MSLYNQNTKISTKAQCGQKFLPTHLIDNGILRKFINKFGILGKRWIQIPPDAYGHTVIAVYEKNTSCKK